jgi:hypothetical protein
MGWLDCHTQPSNPISHPWLPPFIRKQLEEKRQLCKRWQHTGNLKTKDYSTELYGTSNNFSIGIETIVSRPFYKASPHCVHRLFLMENHQVPEARHKTFYGTWARSAAEKARAFAEHLVTVFQPYPSGPLPAAEEPILQALEIPYQLEPPIHHFTHADIQTVINHLNPKKIPWL